MLDYAGVNKLSNILQGKSIESSGDTLETARNYLTKSFETSTKIEKDFSRFSIIKKEQQEYLTLLANQYSWWVNFEKIPCSFISEGGESKVYLSNDGRFVFKINDAVYYNTWLDFLNGICLHNLFFPETAYNLIGFEKNENSFFAVLKQPYIISDSNTDLDLLKRFMEHNSFKLQKNYDYYSAKYGLFIEDLHDENVLTHNGIFFFIGTVFLIHQNKK
jgi:hypothetical protein